MENHDLLTAAAATIEWLREEERLEEIEVTTHQIRLEALREVRGRLEGKPRLRRARTLKAIENLPERPTAETEPPDLVA